MNTITIPKNVTINKDEELVIIPRKEYEKFLRTKKTNGQNIVVRHSFKAPKRHEKFYEELDKRLTKSLRSYKIGNFYGPFTTMEALKTSLEK